MTDRILVPLDGSELAARALPWADALAGDLHAELELVTVAVPDAVSDSVVAEVEMSRRMAPPHEVAADPTAARAGSPASAALIELLEQARGTLQHAPAVVTTILQGDPGPAIVAHAHEHGATMVAMATHARLGVDRAIMGSVAGEVLREAQVPVVLVNPRTELTARSPHRILVALDGSDLAHGVLPFVVPLAQQLGSVLVLFTVEELPPSTVSVQGANIPLGVAPDHAPAEVVKYLEDVAASLQQQGLTAEIAADSGKDRGQTIVAAAASQRCHLIAMSTHGRRGLGRWVVGSVTDTVVRYAEVPVLAVRPPEVRAPNTSAK